MLIGKATSELVEIDRHFSNVDPQTTMIGMLAYMTWIGDGSLTKGLKIRIWQANALISTRFIWKELLGQLVKNIFWPVIL